jgi:hypothetical protein
LQSLRKEPLLADKQAKILSEEDLEDLLVYATFQRPHRRGMLGNAVQDKPLIDEMIEGLAFAAVHCASLNCCSAARQK